MYAVDLNGYYLHDYMRLPHFHIGQAVVCVGGFPNGDPTLPRPQRGGIYHVAGLLFSALRAVGLTANRA